MKFSTIMQVICILVAETDAALNLLKPRGATPIEHNLIRSERPKLLKRDTVAWEMGTRFGGFEYLVNFTIGTPPQSVSAIFDTGSSDLIVNSAANDFCTSANPSPCLGAFSTNASSTSTQVGQGFEDIYEVAGYAGNWYSDTISIAGKSAKDFIFGVADTFSNGTSNVFGVSFFTPSIARGGTAPPTNDSSLGQMVKAGLIPSSAYSVWMDRNTSLGGTVLLGGVDTARFTGELQTYPVLTYPGTDLYISLSLNMTSASVGGSQPVTSDSNSSDFPAAATLDTGNPNLLLPVSLVKNIYSTFGVQAIPLGNGGAEFGGCNCSLRSSTATLDVFFPNLKISIPFSDLVVTPTDELYAAYNIPESERLPAGVCLFMISPTRAGFGNILGDNFLRYVYYVVDLDSKQIGLATSNPTPGKSNIMEIAAGSTAIPSLSGGAAAATGTGTPTGGSSPSGTGSGSSTTTMKSSDGNKLSIVSFVVLAGVLAFSCLLL